MWSWLQAFGRVHARKLVLAAYGLCGLGAFASLAKGYVNATSETFHSMDFQWAGSYLLLQGVDPWREYLKAAESAHVSFALGCEPAVSWMTKPNYAHELYVLLLPFGAMPFAIAARIWFGLTVILSFVAVWLLGRVYGMERPGQLLLLFLLWLSLPFRNSLYVGQQTTLVLVFFVLVFYCTSRAARGVALGLSFAKYSFAPVLVPLLVFRRRFGLLAWSLVPPGIGLLVVWGMVHGNLLQLAFEPLLVNRLGVCPGAGDLMTIVENIIGSHSSAAIWIPVIPAIVYAWSVSRDQDRTPGAEMACISVATLLVFKHLIYDYVFLVIPLAYALSVMRGPRRWLVFALVGFFWYFETMAGLSWMAMESFRLQLASTIVLLGLLAVLEVDARQEKSHQLDFAATVGTV